MRKLRLPGINAPTAAGKVEQIRSYLYQLADQLNQILDQQPAATVQMQLEEPETLFARIKPLILRSADIADSIRTQLKNTFIQKTQLETETLTLHGSLNGLHIHSAAVDESHTVRIGTKFSAFAEGEDRQVFFLFGTDGTVPVHAVLQVTQDGHVNCDHTPGGITVEEDTGTVVLQMDNGGCVTLLSADAFTLE